MARLPADLLPCFREESQELTWREIASSTFTRRVRRSAAISVRLTSRVSCQIRHMHRQNVNPSGESGRKPAAPQEEHLAQPLLVAPLRPVRSVMGPDRLRIFLSADALGSHD